MISVHEARNIILENTKEIEDETVHISSCLNRILSENVFSEVNIPPFNNSAMDGYAVLTANLKGSHSTMGAELMITGNLPAGYTSDYVVHGGTAVRIMTGAPVPKGADAVVPIEFTETIGNKVRILREAVLWENIRFAGEDVKKGDLVIPKGKKLQPADIGMLAAIGKSYVKVTRMPRVSILATGDELVGMEEKLPPGKIRDINSHSLYAQLVKHGCLPVPLGIARDSKAAIREKLEAGNDSHMLIISGGVSAGDYDLVKEVLLKMGMIEKFWKVAIKPGKPVLFGLMGNTLVFGLPGNPGAAMVGFEQFVLPAIYKLHGVKKAPLCQLRAIFEGNIKSKPGFTQFLPGKTLIEHGRIYVKISGAQGSGIFSSLAASDCSIVIPETSGDIKTGDEVTIQIINEIGE